MVCTIFLSKKVVLHIIFIEEYCTLILEVQKELAWSYQSLVSTLPMLLGNSIGILHSIITRDFFLLLQLRFMIKTPPKQCM